MTARQVHLSLVNINKRIHNNYVKEARLHGIELSSTETEKQKQRDFTDSEKEGMNKIIKNAVKRRMKKNIGV